MCENTPENFDWLINYIDQLGTCFKIMQPITDKVNASVSYDSNVTCMATIVIIYRSFSKLFCEFICDVTIDDVYKYTHRCNVEIETGFQGIRVGKYATSSC